MQLAQRMGMLQKRGEVDLGRAAVYFVRWWREEGGLLAAKDSSFHHRTQRSGTATTAAAASESGGIALESLGQASGPKAEGWGFDFQWDWQEADVAKRQAMPELFLQEKMEVCIDGHLEMIEREEREEMNVSPTQIKKRLVMEEKMRRKMRYQR